MSLEEEYKTVSRELLLKSLFFKNSTIDSKNSILNDKILLKNSISNKNICTYYVKLCYKKLWNANSEIKKIWTKS